MRAACNKINILNIGDKTNYQSQNNPDYFYEDLRPKVMLGVDQSNIIPQLVSLKLIYSYSLNYIFFRELKN